MKLFGRQSAAQLTEVMARYPRFNAVGDFNPANVFRNGEAKYRKRKNKQPCPQCGATDLVYQWQKQAGYLTEAGKRDQRWFCFCGRTEVDD